MERVDLAVIGGGPAGSAAAIEAATRGLSAVVFDKATFPRDKCCGDGLTAGALRHLDELGLVPEHVPSWKVVSSVHVSGPNRRPVSFPLPRDRGMFAVIVRRSELDHELLEVAARAGAEVRTGRAVTAVEPDTDHVDVVTEGGRTRASFAIAADGMWSPTRKMLNETVRDYRGEWHAFRQYFRSVSPKAADDLHVWFEPDLLPGYVWSFPLADGSANVGFGIMRNTGHRIQDMKALWPELLARPHIRSVIGVDARPEAAHRSWPIPARLGRLSLTTGRVFFVGDAAGATDPMTGEGIGQALETGRLAVEAIIENGPEPGRAAERYRSELERGMVRDHRLAAGLSRVLGTRWGADASVAVAGLTPWTRRNFARWLFEDYPRAVVATPGRWRRHMFSNDGAFERSRPTR